MKKYRFYGMADSSIPTEMLAAEDFGDEKADGMIMCRASNGTPVLVRRSIALTPMPWSVHMGLSSVYFNAYDDTIAYCRMRGYKPVKNGGGK